MPHSSQRGKSFPYCFFQTFLLENSHLPLRQVNVFMNFIWEKIQPSPPPPFPEFKVIKICFGHMTARCPTKAKVCAGEVNLNNWQKTRGLCI